MSCEGLHLTPTSKRVLEELVRCGRGGVDRFQLAEAVPCDEDTAAKVLRKMSRLGIVQCDRRMTETGKDLRTLYRLSPGAPVLPVLAAAA